MNALDDALSRSLKSEFGDGRLRFSGSTADVFSALMKTYPIDGSKIDWANVRGAIEEHETEVTLHSCRFAAFFEDMCLRFGLSGTVTYAGDSATEKAIEGSVEAFRAALAAIFDIPQHHYFIGPNLSWCMCMTMEGDMAFGRLTTPPYH